VSTYPKAYLRIDPNIDQVRTDLDSFVRLLCAANRQPRRGYFKSEQIARMVLGKAAFHRALNCGDLTPCADGSLYVDGWTEWQEGDLNVGERMRRLRARKRHPAVTPPVTTTVTAPSPDRIPPSEALRRQGVFSSSNEEEGRTAVTGRGNGAYVAPEPEKVAALMAPVLAALSTPRAAPKPVRAKR
jgi:hypothetical protein